MVCTWNIENYNTCIDLIQFVFNESRNNNFFLFCYLVLFTFRIVIICTILLLLLCVCIRCLRGSWFPHQVRSNKFNYYKWCYKYSKTHSKYKSSVILKKWNIRWAYYWHLRFFNLMNSLFDEAEAFKSRTFLIQKALMISLVFLLITSQFYLLNLWFLALNRSFTFQVDLFFKIICCSQWFVILTTNLFALTAPYFS